MRPFRLLSIAISAVLILWVTAICFPQLVLRHQLQHLNFTVHSSIPIDDRLTPLLDTAIQRLSGSEIFDASLRFDVYLCPGEKSYAFFVPMSHNAFAATYPVIQNIFINKSDIAGNEVHRNADRYNVRTLTGTIAHEAAHVLLENALGTIGYRMLPAWKNEGYCDLIAQESSIGERVGIDLLCQGSLDHDYFLGRLRVAQLIAEGWSFKAIASGTFDLKALDERVSERYCTTDRSPLSN